MHRARLSCGGEDGCEVAWRIGQTGQDGSERDSRRDAGIGQEPDGAQPLAGRGDPGLEAGGHAVVHRRDADADRDGCTPRCFGEHVDVTNDERPPRDDREWRASLTERLDAAAGQPVAAFSRLVRIGGRTDRDRLPAPGSATELRAEHFDDVDLDPNARPVAIVGRAVGPALETAHVTEGAAMRAAHVRVQAPAEAHPRHSVERRAAWLLAIDGAHDPMRIEQTFGSAKR